VRKSVVWSVVLALLVIPAAAQQMQKDAVDLEAVYKIKQEAIGDSQVMKTLSFIADVYGGRLTGSPNAKLAGNWALQQMKDWGLSNVHFEPWQFGRGWVNERFWANVTSPVTYPLLAYPLAWTPGTNGLVNAEAMIVSIASEKDFDRYKGKLNGKIVLLTTPLDLAMSTEPLAHRYTDAELAAMAEQDYPAGRGGRGFFGPAGLTPAQREMFARAQQEAAQFRPVLYKFLQDEGIVAIFQEGRGVDGNLFVQSAQAIAQLPQGTHIYDKDTPPTLNQVMLMAEHYNRIYRTLQNGVPVSVELNIQNKFLDDDLNSFDIVAEIPGSDPKLADQIVMIGGHFDSWHAGTGATDNGVGSAVMMEVMRVLKTSGLKMRRTVRIGLWTGEEEGLLGSRAYVKAHFGDPATMQLKQPEHQNFDVYFNIDNGSGKLRGVYLQGNDAAAPIFTEWMKPFASLGMNTLTIRNTGGTDHLSYDTVGLPGFQFIQDSLEYETLTHHSNNDLYDRVQADDLKQMATIVSTFVYQAANRDQMFPRKPLPKPPAATGRGF
jgi:carboxypeptidase Q